MVTKIKDSSGVDHDVRDSRVKTATSQEIGMMKPDGTSTTVDQDGTLHASGSPFSTDSGGYINFNY